MKGTARGQAERRSISVGAYVTTDEQAVAAQAARLAIVDADRSSRASRSQRPLQRDALAVMVEAGQLRMEQGQAGREVAELVYASIAGVRGSVTASYAERIPGGASDDWPTSMRVAYAERFRPWSDWAGRMVVKGVTFRQITLAICADNLGCEQAGNRYRLHHLTIRRKLQHSLLWYAEQAGWIDPLPTCDFDA